jgi:hypothetical protein
MKVAAKRLLAGLLLLLGGAPALAADADGGGGGDVMFGLRGVGEVWQDTAIITNYRSSRFAGAGFFGYGINDWLMVDAEVGYMRQNADTSRAGVAAGALQLVPVTIALEARRDSARAELFGGLGFTAVTFSEETDVGVVAGAKPALDLRAGTRIHTQLVREPITGPGTPGLRGLDVELLIGRRQHHAFGLGTGFDLSAWRVGIGLAARL